MNCPECGGKIYYDSKLCEYICKVYGLVIATNRKLLYFKAIVRGKDDFISNLGLAGSFIADL